MKLMIKIIVIMLIIISTNAMIAMQMQQIKLFNAQFEKEMRAEGRKNRKMLEKVCCCWGMRIYWDNVNIQVTERVTHLKSRFVEGLKAEERQEEEIQKAIIAEFSFKMVWSMPIWLFKFCLNDILIMIADKRMPMTLINMKWELIKCVQNQKVSQAQSNSKQEQITNQVL